MKKFIVLFLILATAMGLAAEDLPVVTVLDFSSENVSRNEMQSVVALISSALFRSGAYTVIDVSQRESILKELEFSLSGCTDESCALEVGKMLSAGMIVTGSIGLIGRKIVVSAKLLETETGKTLGTADGTYSSLEKFIADVDSFVAQFSMDLGLNIKTKSNFPTFEAVGTGIGVVCLGAGIVLMVLGLPDYLAYIDARDAYENASAGDDVTALYNAMNAAWETANANDASTKSITGIALTAGGAAITTVFTILLVKKIKANKNDDISPASTGIGLKIKL